MEFLAVGEPLVEFAAVPGAAEHFHRRLGGDTLNAAIYYARLRPEARTALLTRLGDDAMSGWMLDAIAAEGIDTGPVTRVAGGRPGLYTVTVDGSGERSFAYWRDQAPARGMFDRDPCPETAPLAQAQTILFSGITLAILPPEGRARLLSALKAATERGAAVVFDTNYRPVLWQDASEARDWTARALGVATLAMPSLDDVEALWQGHGPENAHAALLEITPGEIVMTAGAGAVLHRAPGEGFRSIPLPPPVAAVDTTAAGDSFNAGFLAARAGGADVEGCVAAGGRLAACVVGHPGAIIPREAMPG
ncbi:sugar kinase [Pseudoroseicyclus aestuarii]|uniref:2-keto-3-deoxygluconate kinase n=1 Tax=Pseudoroseicyclus aestuarii TaxID=1795041 RepID=A0A318SMW6_9RHOB|nr:sugar kinase [Pseudoroseicyclus aestuarii]PYE81192.1 2-keto-3-deoxygluconate kinase [Pseudoroseicyclus aestuarii]